MKLHKNLLDVIFLGAALSILTIGCGGELGPDQSGIDNNKSALSTEPDDGLWVDQNPRWPGVYYRPLGAGCYRGGVPEGPNCRIASVKPIVAYWLNQNTGTHGVYYLQVNGTCPFGGAASSSTTCKLAPLDPDTAYWIDQDPRWPGVFYKQINGTCHAGDAISGGGNCKLTALEPVMTYSIDVAANGVFYNQVSGGCRYGGTAEGTRCRIVTPDQTYLDYALSYSKTFDGGDVVVGGHVGSAHIYAHTNVYVGADRRAPLHEMAGSWVCGSFTESGSVNTKTCFMVSDLIYDQPNGVRFRLQVKRVDRAKVAGVGWKDTTILFDKTVTL